MMMRRGATTPRLPARPRPDCQPVRTTILLLLALLAVPGMVGAQETFATHVNDTPLEITRRGNFALDPIKRVGTLTGVEGGDVNVIFGDRSLTARQLIIHYQGARITVMEATGSVILYDAGNLAFADHVVFDASNQHFTLTNGRYSTDSYFLTGATIEIMQARTVVIRQGTLTTCDLWEPHYLVVSDKIVVKPGVRYWTYGTTYRVDNYPVAWLPFFTRSLRHRDSAFFLYPGYSNRKGAMVHARYLYHYNTYVRPNFYVDYFENLGVGYGFSNEYHAPGDDGYDRLWGRVYGYYIDQDENKDYFFDGDRYKIAGFHRQELGYDFVLSSRYQHLSDRDFNQDFEQEEKAKGWDQDDLEMERNSYVNLARTEDLYNFRIFAKKRLDDFFLSTLPDTEQLPEVRFELKRDLLADSLPIYYYATADVGKFRRESGGGVDGRDTFFIDEVERGDFNLEFSAPFTVFTGLRAVPFINLRATDYQDPEVRRLSYVASPAPPQLAENNLLRYAFDDTTRLLERGGVAFQTRLAHHFDSLLSKRFEATRLVLQPRFTVEGWRMSEELRAVDHSSPDPALGAIRLTEEPVDFPFIDSADLYRENEGHLAYRLDAKLQGRRAGGGVVDIVRAALSSGYFTESERTDEHEDLVAELFVHPNDWLAMTSYSQYDINRSESRANYVGVTLLSLPGLSTTMLTLGWSEYDPIEGQGQDHVSMSLYHPISDKWSLALDNRFDVQEGSSRKTGLRLTRDLHDWWWDILLRQDDRAQRQSEFEISTRIRLKFPEQQDSALRELAKRETVPY